MENLALTTLMLPFIGAMAGLVLSSTLLGQLLFFEIRAAAPGR